MTTARPAAKRSRSPITVVLAPDSFKGSASATAVARALGAGWQGVRPRDEMCLCPMADGGEGTIDALARAHPSARRVPVTVTGPDDQRVGAEYLLLDDGTAAIAWPKPRV